MYCRAENEAIDNAIKQALLDSAATSNFIQSADGFEITGPSSKIVSAANSETMKATMTALLPLKQLKAGAREAIVVPEIKQALMSVKQLADQEYTTIFILTSMERRSMTMTVSNSSYTNHHCSKPGKKKEDYGQYLLLTKWP
jgi:hypothetical protein